MATHVWADGASQAYKKYLLSFKELEILWITHPLFYDKRVLGNGFEFYKGGSLNQKKYTKIVKLPAPLNFIKDVIITIYYSIKFGNQFELFIGFNNLNAFAGLFLRKIGVVKKVVYHVTDFVPKRFENNLLNSIYHSIESICARYADETWNLSLRMVEARQKYKNINPNDCGIQKEIPMGIWLDSVKKVPWENVKKSQLVFMGHLLKKQGVQYVIQAIPYILEKIPDFHFLVIGGGDYKIELEKLVEESKIERCVSFTGYVDDHYKLELMVAESALAVALYEKGDFERNWTYYTDPGKLKVYLGSGVPVLLTDVPHNAKDIEDNKCGKIIDIEPKSIAKAIISILEDGKKLKKYRENAVNYAAQYDWVKLLDKEFLRN